MFLVNEIGEIIFEHGENFKESCVAKTKILKKFVLEKLATMVDDSKKEEIVEYTSEKYLKPIEKNLSLIFEDIDKSEKEFYANYMKTIDLIFKAESKNRMKVIYLENIIKKIENKELNSDSIISMKKSSENSDSDNSIPDKSVNEIFNEMIQDITKKYSLTPEQVADFKTKVIHYKDIYEQHLEEDLDKYFKHNKKCVITGIITEMDGQKLREGKTREQFLEEKKLADTAKNKSKELLDEIVNSKYKKIDDINSNDGLVVILKNLDTQFMLYIYKDNKIKIVDDKINGSYQSTTNLTKCYEVFDNFNEKLLNFILNN